MKYCQLHTLLIAISIIALSSCHSESRTTETAMASMPNMHADQVYYIERTMDGFTNDLMLHLSLERNVHNHSPKTAQVNTSEVISETTPTHIGPFVVKRARSICKEKWDLEKLILEWIFSKEE